MKKGLAMEDFGQALKQARQSRRATLRELGESIGRSIGYIADIEHNRRRPPDLETVSKIEDFLNVGDSSLIQLARKIRSTLKPTLSQCMKMNPDLSSALLRADLLPTEKRSAAVEKINDILKKLEEET